MLAQIPTATPEQFGSFVFTATAAVAVVVMVLSGMNQLKQLRTPAAKGKRAFQDRFVTKAELTIAIEGLVGRMESYQSSHEKQSQAILEQVKVSDEYSHRRFHELNNVVNEVRLKMASRTEEMRALIDLAMKPMCSKIERLVVTTTAIAVRLRLPIDPEGIRTDADAE